MLTRPEHSRPRPEHSRPRPNTIKAKATVPRPRPSRSAKAYGKR